MRRSWCLGGLLLSVAAVLVGCGGAGGSGGGTGGGSAIPGLPAQPAASLDDPRKVLTTFVRLAGKGDVDGACKLFTASGRQSMIEESGEPSCPAAVRRIFDGDDQAELTAWTFDDEENLKVSGASADYDGYCARSPLHNVKLALVDRGGGWVIMGYDDQLGYTCGG